MAASPFYIIASHITRGLILLGAFSIYEEHLPYTKIKHFVVGLKV